MNKEKKMNYEKNGKYNKYSKNYKRPVKSKTKFHLGGNQKMETERMKINFYIKQKTSLLILKLKPGTGAGKELLTHHQWECKLVPAF